MKTIGFVVNPIAGMGGAVGLKGTDGKSILEKARTLGAKPISPIRAESFLSGLEHVKGRIRLVTGAGRMGEDEALNHGFTFTTFGERKEETTAEDTKEVAKRIKDLGVDLLVFCGGDGTARDILDSVGTDLPVLGVPTGVKMHSSVFAVGPLATARIAMEFLWENLPLREAEVMDVDEEAFRKGRLSAKLYGYLLTPYVPSLIQGAKVESPMTEVEMHNQAAIAIYIIEEMKPDLIYIIGPGTTTRTIGDLLDEKKTLLGVDLFCNKKLIAKDVNEKEILEKIKGKDAKIIVTPIGGQGFIFGRGNLQLSPVVIRQVGLKNIIVIATKHKMVELRSLRVDTGNPDLDDELRVYVKVITDYKQGQMVKIE
ncbi:MAG: ATP-NAD kinase family protein [archaeon]|nr:ATP-NAD kinase family protein [archaeon]MCP8306664.1 ATP-NAD kinase family protein [archaeon]